MSTEIRNRKKAKKVEPKEVVSKIILAVIKIVMAVYVVSLIVPLLWMLLSSVKDEWDYIRKPFSLPSIWMFENYPYAFKAMAVEIWDKGTLSLVSFSYMKMFAISFIFALSCAILDVILHVLTSYAVARCKFVGRKFIFNLAIITMIIPIVGTLSASITVRRNLGLYDNFVGHILTAGASGFGFHFVLLYNAFKGLPSGYDEAAKIDGAGRYSVMFRIYVPLIAPLLFAVFLLSFVAAWNDYTTFITYLPSYPNLAYGTYYFEQAATVKRHSTPQVLAGFVLLAVPSTVIWIVSHKWVVGSMAVGGLKG